MNNFTQLAANVNVFPLVMDLQRQPFLWNKNPCRLSKRGPHYETSDIFLRYKDETKNFESGDFSDFSDEHIPVWYKAIDHLPYAKKLALDLMAIVGGEILGGVLLYRLRPGEKIHSHVDTGWHAETFEKYNICLESNPKAAFCYENEKMIQKAGDVHWFCNTVPHWVINEGNTDHIVLTICIRLDNGYRVPFSPEGWTMDKHLEKRN
jgi:quercetin dioxygenase-like cupin family protein